MNIRLVVCLNIATIGLNLAYAVMYLLTGKYDSVAMSLTLVAFTLVFLYKIPIFKDEVIALWNDIKNNRR